VAKETRELRCVVRYLPTGLDLRLMLATSFALPSSTRTHRARRPKRMIGESLLERG